MTTEMQRAMAEYEEQRFKCRKAVLGALGGAGGGAGIREALQRFRRAERELRRLQGATRAAVDGGLSAEGAPRTARRIAPKGVRARTALATAE